MIQLVIIGELLLLVGLAVFCKYGLPWLLWLSSPLGLILFVGLFVAVERAIALIWCWGASRD